MAIPRVRPGRYPAVLSYGFRPFFLLGSLYAGLAILFWLPLFYGHIETSSLFSPTDWHIHEMLFGYLGAIITGFLLTAIPNWTGQLPVQGISLSVLVAVWFLGRIAVFFSADIGWIASAMVDCAFLLLVVAAAAREIIIGKNWRNLRVIAPITLLWLTNVLFHIEAYQYGASDISRRLGLAMIVVLVTLIGGRVIPSFTRNWLVRENPGRLPAPADRYDAMTLITTAVSLIAWSIVPEQSFTSLMLLTVAVFQAVRLSRWAGDRAWRDPLVLVLHVAYGFVPLGLLLIGLGVVFGEWVPPAVGIHALGIGALGGMTLAVMTRASLGHTGRALKASKTTCVIYLAIFVAAFTRMIAGFDPSSTVWLHISALSWIIAFLGFVVFYAAMLVSPRLGKSQSRVAQ